MAANGGHASLMMVLISANSAVQVIVTRFPVIVNPTI
jgi:hypothetical protein